MSKVVHKCWQVAPNAPVVKHVRESQPVEVAAETILINGMCEIVILQLQLGVRSRNVEPSSKVDVQQNSEIHSLSNAALYGSGVTLTEPNRSVKSSIGKRQYLRSMLTLYAYALC